jgi:hypothetical protein
VKDAAFLCLGIGAWAGATLLPPLLALWFWNVAARRYTAWAAHLLFAPFVIAVEWALVDLVFFAAHDDGSGPPGLGLLLLPPSAAFLVALGGYYACLACTVGAILWRRLVAR